MKAGQTSISFTNKYKDMFLISPRKQLLWYLHVKWPLSKRPNIGFQDQLSLNAGQKYWKMLQREHSAILSAFIKLPFFIKIFVLSIFEWLFYTGFTVTLQLQILRTSLLLLMLLSVDTMKYDDSFECPHNNNFCEAGLVSISIFATCSGNFCHLLITFANSLNPDQDRQNIGPDLATKGLTLNLITFLKEFIEKIILMKTNTCKITQHAKSYWSDYHYFVNRSKG